MPPTATPPAIAIGDGCVGTLGNVGSISGVEAMSIVAVSSLVVIPPASE